MKKTISLMLCALLALSFVACGEKTVTLTEAAEALDKDLAALKAGNFSETGILENSAFANEEAMMLEAMYSQFDYKIGDSAINGDTATVAAEITMVDMGAAFTAYMTAAMEHIDEADWDADGSYFAEMIKGGDTATKDFSVTVNMVKDADGAWTVAAEGNDALYNALTGGLLDSLTGFGEALN